MQRPLPDNSRHSQETNIQAAGGIQTHNPSKQAVTHALDCAAIGFGNQPHGLPINRNKLCHKNSA